MFLNIKYNVTYGLKYSINLMNSKYVIWLSKWPFKFISIFIASESFYWLYVLLSLIKEVVISEIIFILKNETNWLDFYFIPADSSCYRGHINILLVLIRTPSIKNKDKFCYKIYASKSEKVFFIIRSILTAFILFSLVELMPSITYDS